MKLSLKNIGKVGEASVEIDGITVIAGENNTGKSTVGKALYAVFNSFYNIENQIESARLDNIRGILERMCSSAGPRVAFMAETRKTAENIWRATAVKKESMRQAILDVLEQDFDGVFEEIDQESVNDAIFRIMDVLNISDEQFMETILDRRLSAEFNGQPRNIFGDGEGEIILEIRNQKMSILLDGEGVMEVKSPEHTSLHTEVMYIDDPFVIDETRGFYPWRISRYSDHRNHLRSKLAFFKSHENLVDEIIAKEKLERIYEKISAVCGGEIIRDKRLEIGYRRENSDKVLNVKNLSTGLKTFLILKILLMNGDIERNGTIILDEPEIHLHPEWQLLFAELIVLIQKEFGVHVLLNTHSPYFLNALEVYSTKYGIDDKCKYYLASVEDYTASMKDVTGHVEEIYQKLAKPLQELENEGSRL